MRNALLIPTCGGAASVSCVDEQGRATEVRTARKRGAYVDVPRHAELKLTVSLGRNDGASIIEELVGLRIDGLTVKHGVKPTHVCEATASKR